MKEHTTPEQTAKLIELGFEKPKSISSIKVAGDIITTAEDLIGEPSSMMGGKITANYSIGELIEKLPLYRIEFDMEIWVDTPRGGFYAPELIDALFDACVKFKSEGVI